MKKDSEKKEYLFAPASVEQMAARRERRVSEQREMLERGGENRCVVCIGMNIAGPNKRSGLIDAAFLDAVLHLMMSAGIGKMLEARDGSGAELRFINENTGIEALIALDMSPEKLKRICVEIEEQHPAGRLFDMDVIAKNGEKLGRSEPRKCFICAKNASVCARSRAHTVEELQKAVQRMLSYWLARKIGLLAKNALYSEVHITPKPGLVDENNSGANTDMDAELFERSAESLQMYYERIAASTIQYCCGEKNDASAKEFFSSLRSLGIDAEKAMLDATGGVNTHRGAIYSLGLLASAAAHDIASGIFAADECGLRGKLPNGYDLADSLVRTAAELARSLGDNSTATSNGAKMREKYGVEGPVQQAQQGFPLAMLAKAAKGEYYNRHGRGGSELAWAYALIRVMAVMDDNNALKRGGEEGAAFVKNRASELASLAMRLDPAEFNAALLEFDAELIERNISCGGAADMLALALFLEEIEKHYARALALLASSESKARSM